MSPHHCDDHTHTSLADLQDCMRNQRRKLHAQMLFVLLASLLAIGMWLSR